jgi:hypothetical protein
LLVAELVQDFAWLDDPRVNDAIVHVQAVPVRLHEAVVPEEGKMLGKVGFRQARYFEEGFHRAFAFFEDIEDFQPLWVGKKPINDGISVVGLLGEGRFHSFDSYKPMIAHRLVVIHRFPLERLPRAAIY